MGSPFSKEEAEPKAGLKPAVHKKLRIRGAPKKKIVGNVKLAVK